MSDADTRTDRGTGRRTGSHVVVVGGGISGLAAAHRLSASGVRVTVLEASGRLGGKLHAGEIAGVPVDFGAETMLARRPEAVELARAVGLEDRLQPPATISASLWTRGRLRPMPKGHMMGVPGDLAPLAASGVISDEGLARIERDRELPRTEVGDDVAVGAYIADRLGREVVDRLVEPLLGGVYAGDAYRISMRAAVPQLFEAARTHRSLLEGVREIQARAAAGVTAADRTASGRAVAEPATQGGGPVFMGIDGGVGRLPLAVADACRAAGANVVTGASVERLALRRGEGGAGLTPGDPDRATGGGTGTSPAAARTQAHEGSPGRASWEVVVRERSGAVRTLEADGVVLAVPAPAAARLLAAESPAASAELAAVEYASMALVTLAFRRADLSAMPDGSGFLVPPVDGRTIKASTFSSAKWGWLADADPDLFVLRASVGRFGDEADLRRDDADLVQVSLGDLGDATGLSARPVAATVTRWDGGLPQYPVGHLGRVARIREQVAKLPGLRVCGALYEGLGIPACIASARTAADELLATLPESTVRGERE
ncbi:protoporphyrinogen oxidase [Streptomyces sp. 7N604]|uniref:protoporphyrinogen oxidase n=1 Tax=Streptomyces sp. 7N604 TaxID=3457415 RepID=UPI003FD2272F